MTTNHGDATRSLTTADADELAEDRVEAYIEAERREYIAYDGMGASYRILTTSDVREVLAELRAWRALAGARLDIINGLSEDLASFIDPAPQEQTGGDA